MNYLFTGSAARSIAVLIISFMLASCPLLTKQVLADPQFAEARLVKVHDGDTVTLTIKGKEYRTRLIGIDAPEIGQKPWGNRAKEHLHNIIKQRGKTVYVETDVVQFDKYNRLLAYLWTKENVCINELMLLDGYAVLFTIQPNSRHVERFKKAQWTARQEKRGVWGPDGLKEKPLDYKRNHSR